MSRITRFWQDPGGVVQVEFALLVPIVFLVLAIALEAARLSIAYALIDRALEEGVHAAKLERGRNAEALVQQSLDKWRFGVFNPSDLKLTFTSSSSMALLLSGGSAGAGVGGDSVHLKVEAKLGILEKVLPEGNPMKGDVEIHLFYINEPEEKVTTDAEA